MRSICVNLSHNKRLFWYTPLIAYDLNYESDLFESEQGQSYDIASDLDYISHRRRSNTAQRLDRLKQEKINQSRTKTIVWRCNSPTGSQSDDRFSQDSPTSIGDDNEPNKQDNGIQNRRSKSPPRKSGLTRLLERFPSIPKNPFDEFAQFDGGMSETVPVKKIMIFIALNQDSQNSGSKAGGNTQLDNINDVAADQKDGLNTKHGSNTPQSSTNPPSNRSIGKSKNNDPLEIVIVSSARVQDLIGLICWQYTNEGREPELCQDINRYCLRIAEDNGEVDPDFPSLNPQEPLSKFNFPSLALTEKKSEEKIRDYFAGGYRYYTRLPSIAQNVITSSTKVSNASSRFAALTRIIFKDAKLDSNQ